MNIGRGSDDKRVVELPVCVFPAETAVVEDDFATIDIIAKSPSAKRQAILPFTLGHALKFLDVVLPAPIIRIGLQYLTRTSSDG